MRASSVEQLRAALAERIGAAPAMPRAPRAPAAAAVTTTAGGDTAIFSAEALRLAGLGPEATTVTSRPSPPVAPTVDVLA